MKKMDPLINLNDSSHSVLYHMRVIILAPTPILSNEVSMEPVTYPQQFHKGKVGPSIKSSFYPAKGHLKLIRAGTELRLVR